MPLRPSLLALSLLFSATVTAETPITPAPAEIAPRAAEDLLTRVVQAGERLVAIGDRGHILLSDDAGEHWTQVAVPVRALLTSAMFVDAKNGWAVGHDAVILHTQDAGQTWTLQQFSPGAEPLLDVYFVDLQRGYAVGAYGQFLATTDGGASWQAVENALTEEAVHLNAIARLGDGSLLLVGELGMLARSEDEGRTWTRLESPYESSLFAVEPFGERGAVIGGLRGNVFMTTDVLAAEWQAVDTGSVQSVFGIARRNGAFWLAGLNSSLLELKADGTVRRPETVLLATGSDSASNLPPRREQEGAGYADVLALDAETFITVGDAGVRKWRVSAD
jgi:photosystem II stability/assembly factor-like uncharacterized protein